jgi:formylglycine-generating enzyme required for sulfatase activity
MRRLLALAALLIALPAGAVEIEWVYVGDPGNPPDTEVMTCCVGSVGTTGYGSVAYGYFISKYEITNAEYVEFLNAVARSDPKRLFNPDMQDDARQGGITRSGAAGHYQYAAKAGFENRPVNYVSFYDALRFANWLHNGQPTGKQRASTTEDGAYTITLSGVESNSTVRNVHARFFLTSEDEWYKAAYYDAASGSCFDYPTATDVVPDCVAPGDDTGNAANYCKWGPELTITDVGAYALSEGPFGTFDQGGNVFEWNEAVVSRPADGYCGGGMQVDPADVPACRGIRGGHYGDMLPSPMAASYRDATVPEYESLDTGVRVATVVPEPAEVLLVLMGGLVLAAARRRRG